MNINKKINSKVLKLNSLNLRNKVIFVYFFIFIKFLDDTAT